jgi:hypothetical protein
MSPGIQVSSRGHAIGRFVTKSFGLWINHLFAGACSPQFRGSDNSWRTASPIIANTQPCGCLLFDICCREEEWKCLHLARESSRIPSCAVFRMMQNAYTIFFSGRISDKSYLASLLGGSTISPAGYKAQFLPLIWAQKFSLEISLSL